MRLDGIDEIVLSLTAHGLTAGEVSAHFAEVYDAKVSTDTVSRITEKVVEEMTEWRNRPLDRGRHDSEHHDDSQRSLETVTPVAADTVADMPCVPAGAVQEAQDRGPEGMHLTCNHRTWDPV